MTNKQVQTNKVLINKILLVAKAGGCYISGDLLFSLAFRTTKELKKICSELNINIR